MKWRALGFGIVSVLLFSSGGGWADPPAAFDYQGKILVNDIPLTGPGYFKYAIANEAGTTNFWSHNGTPTGEPTAYITNNCYNGVFTAIIGGAPMTAINPDIFALNTSLYLRVWFSSDKATFNEMLPAQRLLSAPYAINADQLDGYDAADLLGGSITETDPVFTASAAYSVTDQRFAEWNAAYGWGDHAAEGYLTSYTETDPVFSSSAAFGISAGNISDWDTAVGWGDHALAGYLTSYTETDPVWTAASNGYYRKSEADSRYVNVTGDTMTGALNVDDAGSSALRIGSTLAPVAIGHNATGGVMGVAVGDGADAADYGAAIGYQAKGSQSSVAMGWNAQGYGSSVVLGVSAQGTNSSVAVGPVAKATQTNVAIGRYAAALGGTNRIAIGQNVTNDVDNSARIRGALYLDGGAAIYGRTPFATGSFQPLLPLPPLNNVVYVSTNGKSTGPGTIDRPFDTPQNAYNYAATAYAGQPAAVVIAAGRYPALNMNAGNIHVIGESRSEISNLTVSAAANSIAGKQRVENLVVLQAAVVAAEIGSDVKFHNCRFEQGLGIYGSGVEVQDCFALAGNGVAITVGSGAHTISHIAIYNSSLYNESESQGTLHVNQKANEFQVIGCQIVNAAPAGGTCIKDMEPGPINPVHLYSHNYIRGKAPPPEDPGLVAVAVSAPAGNRILAFVQNVVVGNVGDGMGSIQFYANNVVYGVINYIPLPGYPGWTQAGAGAGADAANNTEHQTTNPALPAAWLD